MRNLFEQLVGRSLVLGAVALIAVGLSGGVAAVFGAVGGRSFVAGDPPGVVYSRARCADFREYAPHAPTCELAATEHHYGEVVDDRVAAGVVGLLVLGACLLGSRRRLALFATDRLPRAFDHTVGATAFGFAAIGLLGYGIDQLALGYDGAGAWLSGGLVAMGASIAFAIVFVKRCRDAGPTTRGVRLLM